MGSRFSDALDPIGETDSFVLSVKGWLELDNGFLFFVDKAMWRRTVQLFTDTDPAPEV